MRENMTMTRRAMLGGALAAGAAATLGAGGLAFAEAKPESAAPADAIAPQQAEQYGFWIDTRQCVGCGNCVEACVKYNETPADMEPRRTVVTYETQRGMRAHVSTACMHCAEPACAQVCPAGAIEKRADGIVDVHKERCMGCKYCYQACPFQVPHYAPSGMDKCDCCLGNGVAPGDAPHCVQACNKNALHYGPIGELQARAGEAAELLRAPTKPSCLIS